MGVVAASVATALAACATPPPARPAPQPAPPAAQGAQPAPQPARPAPQPTRPAARPSRHVGWIQIFDCSSADEMKRGESLRAWRSGGPEGATWNWYGSDLVCRVVVDADCDGKGRTVLKLGRSRAPVARGTLTLARGQAAKLALRVPAKTWQRALERPKKAIYQKLTVAVQVSARCTGGGPERRWSDSFVGGFAGGE